MAHRAATQRDYQRRIMKAQQLLESSFEQPDPVSPKALAEVANLSLHHFHRVFKGQTGETVMQHIRRLRIERAARRLRHSDQRLLDIAIEAGYDSHEAFTRAFNARFGLPPSEFRKQPSLRLQSYQAQVPQAPQVEVEVRSLPAVSVAYLRGQGALQEVPEYFHRLIDWAKSRDLLDDTPRLYGLYPDDPDITEPERFRFDVCVALDAPLTLSPSELNVGFYEIPAGRYAVGVHRGAYETLSESYLDIIGRWFPQSGHALAPDPVVEHYLNDPARTPTAALRTEVRVRILES